MAVALFKLCEAGHDTLVCTSQRNNSPASRRDYFVQVPIARGQVSETFLRINL